MAAVGAQEQSAAVVQPGEVPFDDPAAASVVEDNMSARHPSGRLRLPGEEEIQQQRVDELRSTDVGPVPAAWDQF